MALELDVSAKTIQRDLEFMRDRLGLPIIFKRSKGGYCYSEPVASFPGTPSVVSGKEILALFVAQKALGQEHGSSFEKQVATAFRKLTDNLPESISFNWDELDRNFSFNKIGASKQDIEVFELVAQAVQESREISFTYTKLNNPVPERRKLQPYHLGSIENQWYVIGFDHEKQHLRTFALSRMTLAKLEDTLFRKPEDFSIAELLRNSFGVFAGGPNRYTVRVLFEASVAQLILERTWQPTQKMVSYPSGEVELQLELSSLREVERWILSWGPRARVLAPPELIRRVRESAAKMAGLYPPESGE